jgi:arsenate reductase
MIGTTTSAGSEQTRVNPVALAAMHELGIDISSHTSKTLDRFLANPWDYVITVCDNANESCPVFAGAAHRLHWSSEDRSAAKGSDDEKLAEFRRIRDQMRTRLEAFLSDPEAS